MSVPLKTRVGNALVLKALVSASVPQCLGTENSVIQCSVLALKIGTSASNILKRHWSVIFSAFSAKGDFLDENAIFCKNRSTEGTENH